ncbi:MAG: DUF2927 domain-containing protein [Amaricoccus sp.]|uniref:DUF2927 domain-containing protein n=1 Tax=Amaricoccus sp. TaxID=1872485 RepID=UPI0039E47AB9
MALAFCGVVAMAGCVAHPPPEGLSSVRFGAVTLPQGVARSNHDLGQDFLDLTFALESGETLKTILRYETPVRVYMGSPALAPYAPDLAALLKRIRVEAGVDIATTDDPASAQIRIEAVPAAEIARIFPTAACFIVPGETSWADFMRDRDSEQVRWSQQTTLQRAAIFLPPDTTPQDLRDCLNEEVTQALGPANDLYRLPDTIWNDDNFHGMATPFDMLMLRTLYQPEFHSGMTRAEVAARLGKVLDRVNPAGRGLPRTDRAPESKAFATALETALDRGASHERRLGAAQLAAQIAAEMRPVDHRLGVALLTLGRLSLRQDPAAAAQDFSDAYDLFSRQLGPKDVRTAQAGVHLAALAVGTGQYDLAIQLANRHIPVAEKAQNAILIAGLLSVKAEAQSALGQADAARETRLDSLRWARYGFGDTDGALAREQAQLAALQHLEQK